MDQIRLLKNGSDAVKERAAAVALRNLAANHTNNQAMIGDSNGIPPLLNLLQTGTTDDQKIRAAWALNELSQHPNNRSKIINSGGISILEHARDTTISPTKAHAEDILKILNKESRAKKTLNYVAKRLNIKK